MINIDQSWTLFLDRDGVINERIPDDYVRTIEQFSFIEGSLKAIVELSDIFGLLVVVTNQQGIGKGLMTEGDLASIHGHLKHQVAKLNGCIEKVYHCSHLASTNSIYRKPQPGMAWQAKEDFPLINFSRSVMVGDSISDMEFGSRLGMKTVFITSRTDIAPSSVPSVDYQFSSLRAFTDTFQLINI